MSTPNLTAETPKMTIQELENLADRTQAVADLTHMIRERMAQVRLLQLELCRRNLEHRANDLGEELSNLDKILAAAMKVRALL